LDFALKSIHEVGGGGGILGLGSLVIV